MFPVKLALLVFAVLHVTVARSDMFAIQKPDVNNPACKYLLGEIVRLDQTFLDVSSFFPKVQAFARKYAQPKGRTKRGLDALGGILSLSKYVTGLLNQSGTLFKRIPPCFYWVRSYVKFWLHDVLGNILKEQFNLFFDV